MTVPTLAAYTAFADNWHVASGDLRAVAATLKALVDAKPDAQILIFDNASGAQVDMNLHGTLADVLQRLPTPRPAMPLPTEDTTAPRGAGRPKLGVVGREVTLLPRHWEWLNSQPGGASVALRKLVEHAQRENRQADAERQAREAGYKFMAALAGDQGGFEEASRALFARNQAVFESCIAAWPADVREHLKKLASASFGDAAVTQDGIGKTSEQR